MAGKGRRLGRLMRKKIKRKEKDGKDKSPNHSC
jgi:hypothetical protein